ncbi:Crp/Fnr family transcriptional regulator [Brevundimonas sp. UBA5936]|uniref:Crp/Fnr family transcriptional regulator n=1 Tax=Brevundimonas sp. UBA5936 TaxID=1946133 RepID=UPI0025C52101|nr:Crp/Fnr family transcriptional regulator [Brevundimonas sp. UBA5936]
MSRLSSFSPSRAFITAPARELGVADHPVFQALPLEARQRIDATGRLQRTQSFGRALAEHELHFVLNGAVGLFPGARDICVSLVPAGAVQGWDRALWPTSPGPVAVPLVETLLFSTPAASILDTLGRDWLTRLVMLQAQQRLRGLEAEACCNASHAVLDRLAKWIVRLHEGSAGAPLHITQAQFGQMLGVQRTSVNVAAARLQALGLVRFGRGRVRILDLEGLRAASCCVAPAASLADRAAPVRAPESKSFLQAPESPLRRIA